MKSIFLGLSVCVSLLSHAASVEVTNARQMWPWNEKVEVRYVITGEADERCDVTVKVKSGGKDVSSCIPFAVLDQLMNKAPGNYKLVFDPRWLPADVTDGQLSFTLEAQPTLGGKYMIVDISDSQKYTISYADDIPAEALTEEKSPGMDSNIYRETKIVLRRIHPGVFMMGSPETETGHSAEAKLGAFFETQHQVTLTNEFWIGVFPMSYGQFKHVCPDNTHVYWDRSYTGQVGDGQGFASSINRADLLGAGSVTKWPQSSDVDEAEDVAFIPRLRNRTKGQLPTGFVFSLPTEAQWEYACRAGTTTAFNDGSDCVLEADGKTCLALDALGYYKESGRNFRIGAKKPNAWGLYDCHGGVFEMVNDRTTTDYLANLGTSPVVEPKGLDYAEYDWCHCQIVRGGSGWNYPNIIPLAGTAAPCRSAARTAFFDLSWGQWGKATDDRGWTSVGFRLAVIREVQNGVDK